MNQNIFNFLFFTHLVFFFSLVITPFLLQSTDYNECPSSIEAFPQRRTIRVLRTSGTPSTSTLRRMANLSPLWQTRFTTFQH